MSSTKNAFMVKQSKTQKHLHGYNKTKKKNDANLETKTQADVIFLKYKANA